MKKLFYYCPLSPSGLRWATSRFTPKGALLVSRGQVAGTLMNNGYWRVNCVEIGMVMCHRIVWELHNGPLAEGLVIDHLDRNPVNNKIENLRAVTQKTNTRNSTLYSNNQTGVKGVSYFEPKGRSPRWSAAWRDLEGRLRSKAFSVGKWGDELAQFLAEETRDSEIQKLNLQGAGYMEETK